MGEAVTHLGTGALASVVVALLARVAWRAGGCAGVSASLVLWGVWACVLWLLLVALVDLASGWL